MEVNYNKKKEIFSELRDKIYEYGTSYINEAQINEIKISSLKNKKIIDEIRALKVIELDSLKGFFSYVNYDHFLIFKFNDEFYFCDTELAYSLREESMIKISDFNFYLRKDKMKKIDIKSNSN